MVERTLCICGLVVACAAWEFFRMLARIRERSIDEHDAFIDRMEQEEDL
jgi:hypothetical protein